MGSVHPIELDLSTYDKKKLDFLCLPGVGYLDVGNSLCGTSLLSDIWNMSHFKILLLSQKCPNFHYILIKVCGLSLSQHSS